MSKLRIVVHVGMRKAASSTLQQLFVRNKAKFAQHGILYPAFQGRAYNHRLLNDQISWPDQTQEVATFMDGLETAIATSNVDTVLFSYEGWAFGATAPKFFRNLADRLDAELSVVLVVRQPEEYLNSWYAHRVMHLRKSVLFPVIFRNEIRSKDMSYGTSFRQWSDQPDIQFIGLPLNGITDVKSLMLDVLGLPPEQAVETGSYNKSGSAYEIEIFRRLHFRQNLSGLHVQQPAKTAVHKVCEEQGWPNDSFYGVTEELTNISEAETLESLDAFAQSTWGRPWKDVFPAAFTPSRPANMIDPDRIPRSLEHSLEAAVKQVEKWVTSNLPDDLSRVSSS